MKPHSQFRKLFFSTLKRDFLKDSFRTKKSMECQLRKSALRSDCPKLNSLASQSYHSVFISDSNDAEEWQSTKRRQKQTKKMLCKINFLSFYSPLLQAHYAMRDFDKQLIGSQACHFHCQCWWCNKSLRWASQFKNKGD
jgi:hypothetical protein